MDYVELKSFVTVLRRTHECSIYHCVKEIGSPSFVCAWYAWSFDTGFLLETERRDAIGRHATPRGMEKITCSLAAPTLISLSS